ncbi:MAG: hypothetical protein IJR89_07295 [Clostridia bacterium]|nr:hypothetical protein [Clostridia bacterium]
MKKRKIALFLLTAFLCGALPACAGGSPLPEEKTGTLPAESAEQTETPETETPPKAGPVRVLFIGNSHTYFNDMPTIFGEIAAADGREIEVKSVLKGGWTLEKHANKTDECGEQIEKMLQEERFDYVILQENSDMLMSTAYYPTRYEKAVASLVGRIHKNGAEPILYSTWGNWLEKNTMDTEKTRTLAKRNTAIGRELDVPVAYAGFAFMKVYSDPANRIKLHYTDNHHPSLYGSCLAAMTIYATAFPDSDIRAVPYHGKISEAFAATLKNAAYEVVKDPAPFLEG